MYLFHKTLTILFLILSPTILYAEKSLSSTRQKYAFHGLPAHNSQDRPIDAIFYRSAQKNIRKQAVIRSKRHFADQKNVHRMASKRMRLREAQANRKKMMHYPQPAE